MRIGDLAPIAIILVIAGIVLGIGAEVLVNIQTQLSAAKADQAAANATLGLAEISSWVPTIALVIAAALVIGIIFTSFAGKV